MTCTACGAERISRSIDSPVGPIAIGMACSCGAAEDRRRDMTLETLASVVWAYSSVPERFREAEFDASTPSVVRRKFAATLEQLPDLRDRYDEPNIRDGIARVVVRGRGIGIFGGNGFGKSHVMGAFLRCARQRLVPGVMVPATELQLELERGQRFDARESTAEVTARYSRAALLVIDDADKIAASNAAIAAALYELIDSRSRNRRPLFLTTNVAPSDVAYAMFGRHERHGVGVEDRWLDMLDWVEYTGAASRRGMSGAAR